MNQQELSFDADLWLEYAIGCDVSEDKVAAECCV